MKPVAAPDPFRTRASLLGRIRDDPNDQAAWEEFVAMYGPRIYQWSRGRGLSAADAQDVTQNVLVKLSKHLANFRYDGSRSFRGWLHTVTANVLNDYLRSLYRQEDMAAGGSVIASKLDGVAARTELKDQFSELFHFELMQEAIRRVKDRVSANRWKAFELTAVEELSGAEAAAQMGIPIATIYTSKSQILQQLRAEVAYLEKEPEDRVNNN